MSQPIFNLIADYVTSELGEDSQLLLEVLVVLLLLAARLELVELAVQELILESEQADFELADSEQAEFDYFLELERLFGYEAEQLHSVCDEVEELSAWQNHPMEPR